MTHTHFHRCVFFFFIETTSSNSLLLIMPMIKMWRCSVFSNVCASKQEAGLWSWISSRRLCWNLPHGNWHKVTVNSVICIHSGPCCCVDSCHTDWNGVKTRRKVFTATTSSLWRSTTMFIWWLQTVTVSSALTKWFFCLHDIVGVITFLIIIVLTSSHNYYHRKYCVVFFLNLIFTSVVKQLRFSFFSSVPVVILTTDDGDKNCFPSCSALIVTAIVPDQQ